ncbi:hypothetical protein, conserved [Eimeria acervulina]|uniref:SAM-dependent MTase RsmB/NOP-type domain-containing protein n=1 Tax=Eimeria acervulina TaxID=5801 RepID=U6GW33_EIMAC|nr:hypothetical protein, conserved [Eimeria acervulina]CDI82759.1 hypothetical protein, conserved [Eimeria acervulina]
MARGKRSFRGAELMGKWRASKYQRAAAAETNNKNSKKTKETYAEIVYENAAFEEYYKAQDICPQDQWDNFMAIQRLPLPGMLAVSVQGTGSQLVLMAFAAAVRVNVSAPLWKSARDLLLKMSTEGVRSNLQSGQWDTASKVDMKKDGFYREIRSQIINEDFRPHHLVLDMCSSPGSKTSEMLDMLQWDARLREPKERGGFVGLSPVAGAVIANDVDLKRAVTLTHQVQKLASPSVAVSCLDVAVRGVFAPAAACFPTLYESAEGGPHKEKLQFDRILADVPCSGDGTLRKNLDVWRSWNTGGGHSMHPIQLSILYRGLQLLHVDGRIVYSTCSLNPLEDEVGSTACPQCRRLGGSPDLWSLKWSKGKSSWLVPAPPAKEPILSEESSKPNAPSGSQTTFFRTFDEVPEEFRHRIRPTMFPPPGADSMCLEKCVRVLPHHNNTGGFFVCCLRKVAELDCTPPCRSEGGAATLMGIHPVEPEPNPLLGGSLLPEESNINTQPTAASGGVEDVSEVTSTAVTSEEAGSLYALAAAVSKPGSLFHILLPANCDAEGSKGLQMIFDFFGLDDRTPLLSGDLRDPGKLESLDPSLLFRRVHSHKKMFLLSRKLADLVKICYGTPGVRPRKELLAHAQSRQGGSSTDGHFYEKAHRLRQLSGWTTSAVARGKGCATFPIVRLRESQARIQSVFV